MLSSRLAALVAASTALGVVAQTSLYIPGFDPQPISANILGVGSDGKTTWQIATGTPSGGLSDVGFFGTATLIEGPSDVQVYISNDIEYLSNSCTINNGIADCTAVAAIQGPTTTITVQETASPFAVQLGSSLAPASPTAANTPSAPASSPTASPSGPSSPSGAPSSPSKTASNTSDAPLNPTTTQNPSGASTLAASSLFAGLIAVVTVIAMC